LEGITGGSQANQKTFGEFETGPGVRERTAVDGTSTPSEPGAVVRCVRGQREVVPHHGILLTGVPVGCAAHPLPQPELGHAQTHGTADCTRHELLA